MKFFKKSLRQSFSVTCNFPNLNSFFIILEHCHCVILKLKKRNILKSRYCTSKRALKLLLLLCAWGNIDGIHISDCVHFMGKDCSIRDIRKKIPRRWKNLNICQPYQTIILKVQVSKYYIAKKSVFYVIHRPK